MEDFWSSVILWVVGSFFWLVMETLGLRSFFKIVAAGLWSWVTLLVLVLGPGSWSWSSVTPLVLGLRLLVLGSWSWSQASGLGNWWRALWW